MFKDFIVKKMMESQLKELPQEQRDMLIEMVTSNPEFFQKVAVEIQNGMKAGKSQQEAALEVMQRHRAEFEEIGKKYKK
jgi:hypothetical protein